MLRIGFSNIQRFNKVAFSANIVCKNLTKSKIDLTSTLKTKKDQSTQFKDELLNFQQKRSFHSSSKTIGISTQLGKDLIFESNTTQIQNANEKKDSLLLKTLIQTRSFSSHEHRGGIKGVKHQTKHRMQEKLGMKALETTIQTLPRLAMLKKRLGVTLVARKLLRGVAIALPGIGGVFAAIMTYSDGKRSLLEKSHNNTTASVLFGFACAFDIVDFLAHSAVMICMAEMLPHSLGDHHHVMHLAEQISLAVAVFATGSAIAGEYFTPHAVPIDESHSIETNEKNRIEQEGMVEEQQITKESTDLNAAESEKQELNTSHSTKLAHDSFQMSADQRTETKLVYEDAPKSHHASEHPHHQHSSSTKKH